MLVQSHSGSVPTRSRAHAGANQTVGDNTISYGLEVAEDCFEDTIFIW